MSVGRLRNLEMAAFVDVVCKLFPRRTSALRHVRSGTEKGFRVKASGG